MPATDLAGTGAHHLTYTPLLLPPTQVGALPPIEDVPGLEKGASNGADALVKLMWGLSKNEHFRGLIAETGESIGDALLLHKDEDEVPASGEW